MNGCNCCIAGATTTPDITDPCVCNAGVGAVFVGSTGGLFVRSAVSNPCSTDDWSFLYDTFSDNNCVDGGVGPLFAVKEVGFSDNRLIINSAAEHTTKRDRLPMEETAFGAYTHPGGGPDTVLLADRDLPFTNPSTCRAMECLINAGGWILYQGANGAFTADFAVDILVDGILSETTQIKARPGGTTYESLYASTFYAVNIPAGGSVEVSVRFRMIATAGGWTGNGYVRTSLVMFGSTV